MYCQQEKKNTQKSRLMPGTDRHSFSQWNSGKKGYQNKLAILRVNGDVSGENTFRHRYVHRPPSDTPLGLGFEKAPRYRSPDDFRAHWRCLLILPRHDQGRSNLYRRPAGSPKLLPRAAADSSPSRSGHRQTTITFLAKSRTRSTHGSLWQPSFSLVLAALSNP